MKNLFKKIGALLMAAVMVLSMCTAVFATNDPMVADHATIKGINKEDGITVKAYKIITYNENGTYSEVLENTIEKTEDGTLNPTSANIEALAKRTNDLTDVVNITDRDDEGVYTTSALTPGTWMIIVTGSNTALYNPAIISVKMDTDGKYKYGTLDFSTDTWNDNGTVYMKKSEPEIKKTAETVVAGNDIKGTQYGDIIKFTITADVPSYESSKDSIQYSIEDTLDGLSLVNKDTYVPSATIDGKKDATLTAAVEKAIVDGNTSFTVNDLGDEWIIAHRGGKIVITYYAKVTSDAQLNIDLNTNTAKLTYSTNDKVQSKTSKTKHYTFGIDTSVVGTTETGTPNKTGEFVKINQNGEVGYDEKTGEVTKTTETELLSGAEFQLHIGKPDGELFTDARGNSTFTTDASGKLEINGLDSDVVYYLVETKAPTGYKLVSTPIEVKINASFEGDTLTGYDVVIGGKTTHYEYNENAGTVKLVNDKDHPSNPYGFKNTKISELPSTGGMGTYLFTIIGVVVMAVAAGAFFISRRRGSEE